MSNERQFDKLTAHENLTEKAAMEDGKEIKCFSC